jgi:predicted neutral ceramidase superfamily lipid hydrolase
MVIESHQDMQHGFSQLLLVAHSFIFIIQLKLMSGTFSNSLPKSLLDMAFVQSWQINFQSSFKGRTFSCAS